MDFLDDLIGSQPKPAVDVASSSGRQHHGKRGPPMLGMLSDMLTLRDGTDSRSIVVVDPSIEDGTPASATAAAAAEAAQPCGKLGSLEVSESRKRLSARTDSARRQSREGCQG